MIRIRLPLQTARPLFNPWEATPEDAPGEEEAEGPEPGAGLQGVNGQGHVAAPALRPVLGGPAGRA